MSFSLDHRLKSCHEAWQSLISLDNDKRDQVILRLASKIEQAIPDLLVANQKDLDKMSPMDPKYDRLKLTEQRLRDIAHDLRNVAGLKNPIGEVLEDRTLENGIKLQKKRVPIGLIGIIYEARPNVTFDVFALTFKTGNACILKGGSDAWESNQQIVKIIAATLEEFGINSEVIQLLPPDRAITKELLEATKWVDMLIPRGSRGLIDYVRDHAKIPVIETGAGIVHTYIAEKADIEMAKTIILNAKTRRVSVCNALDCLVVDSTQMSNLPYLIKEFEEHKVTIYADQMAYEALKNDYPSDLLKKAMEDHYGQEFLDYKMSVKTVSGINDAIKHIQQYTSKHSEAIITEDEHEAITFLNQVDAAAVYLNASTAFTDGGQFGMGAEIGISTQKLHARGPMALPELTTYKWIAFGNGQIRP
jgi:glutamate-5-semialdehyde dehydrogenase